MAADKVGDRLMYWYSKGRCYILAAEEVAVVVGQDISGHHSFRSVESLARAPRAKKRLKSRGVKV